jgi:hypothetical protein
LIAGAKAAAGAAGHHAYTKITGTETGKGKGLYLDPNYRKHH